MTHQLQPLHHLQTVSSLQTPLTSYVILLQQHPTPTPCTLWYWQHLASVAHIKHNPHTF